jgi:hypothetical protein
MLIHVSTLELVVLRLSRNNELRPALAKNTKLSEETMKRILLATVATLPLLAVGMGPVSSQDMKHQENAGISRSQESTGSQRKEVQGKSEGAAKVKDGSGAQVNRNFENEPGRTEGRAVSDHDGNAGAEDRQAKDRAQTATKGENRKAEPKQAAEDRTADQATSGKSERETSAGAKRPGATRGQVGESQSKSKKADELSKGPQAEPARTTGQATRSNQESDRPRQGTERVQQNDRVHNGRSGQSGEGGGRVTLNEEQRTRIEKTVLSGRDVPRIDRVDFTVDVGTVVPREVRFVHVPETLVEINPEWRDDEYFVVRQEIVIVDRSRRIVAVVPLGSTSATYKTRSTASVAAGDIDIRSVQEILIKKGYYHGSVDGELGPETRQALISFQEHEGIEARGVIDERTYVALGIRAGSGRTEGRVEGRTDERAQDRSEGRSEGRTEGRAFQTEEKKPRESEVKRDQSSISSDPRGASKSSESRHVTARAEKDSKDNGARKTNNAGPNNGPSALDQGEKAHATSENKPLEPQGGTVGQSMRPKEPSSRSSKSDGASESQRRHDE